MNKSVAKKKGERNVIKLVRKSNELVEARYKFDIWETRVFTKMLTMVRKADEDFQTYRIYLKDVIKEYGLENNKDAYERLRAGGFKLMRKIVKVVRNTEEGLMELNTPIVVGVENLVNTESEDAKFIDVSFHPKMKLFLLSLQSHFTIYDVRNILRLPSSYSIRIYQLLKQYQTIGRRKFLLKELKEIIGVIEVIDPVRSYKIGYDLSTLYAFWQLGKRRTTARILIYSNLSTLYYASELDMLNVVVFGVTAKQWKQANPGKKGNIRDHADGLELLILSNLEAINTYLLKWDTDQEQRFKLLGEIAQHQREILPESQAAKRLIRKTKK